MPSALLKLADAAACGSVARTMAVLSGGPVDIDGRCDASGLTALMTATQAGYLRIVRILLRHGASAKVADDDGLTPLHISVTCGHLAISKALVKAGADLEARIAGKGEDCIDGTPLHLAASTRFYQGVALLIGAGANVDSELDSGATPLYIAASEGRVEAVNILLNAGANPLIPAYEVQLPVEAAVKNGHLGAIRELVQRCGIDHCTSDGGALVLKMAASNNHVDIAIFFMRDAGVKDKDQEALCSAAQRGSEACVKLLLTFASGRMGKALLRTFGRGRYMAPRIARLFINAGADITSRVRFRDKEGEIKGATPTEVCQMALGRPDIKQDTADGIKGVSRLLKQVVAASATSWAWPVDAARHPAERGGVHREKSRMVASMKRAPKPGAFLATALSRCV